jgi:hypothetical protein
MIVRSSIRTLRGIPNALRASNARSLSTKRASLEPVAQHSMLGFIIQ